MSVVDDEYIPVYPWHALVPCMIRHISTQTALEENSTVSVQRDDLNHIGEPTADISYHQGCSCHY